MACPGSDSEEEIIAALHELEKNGLVTVGPQVPPQSLPGTGDGNSPDSASWDSKTIELSACRVLAGMHMDTSTSSEASSTSISSILELPFHGDDSEAGEAAGSKRRKVMDMAVGAIAGADEPPAAQPSPDDTSEENAGVEPPADPDAWNKKSTREKRMFIGNRLRRMKWYEKFQASYNKKMKRAVNWPARWTELTAEYKQKFIDWWAAHTENTCGAAEKAWAVKNFVAELAMEDPPREKRKQQPKVKQVLLTYNGQWGDISWQASIPKTQDVRELTATLHNSKFCQQLWQKTQTAAGQIAKKAGANDYAVSLELCPRTLEEAGLLRIHAHLALVSSTATLVLKEPDTHLFGSKPFSRRVWLQGRADRDNCRPYTTWRCRRLASFGRIRAPSRTRISR